MHNRPHPRAMPSIPAHEEELDEKNFNACIEYVKTHAAGELEGLYGPGSLSWTIVREPAILLGLAPAVVLQMAHPAIAAGVAQHSDYKSDALGRTRRTLASLYHLTFGTLTEVLAITRRLYRIHRLIRGTIEDNRTAYRANEQPLLRWVGATTSASVHAAFTRFVRPFGADEAQRAYAETRLSAAASGILPQMMPETAAEFEAWYEGALDSDDLRPTRAGRDVVHGVFSMALAGGALGRIITTGLLPPRWREAFQLPWGRWEIRSFEAFAKAMRTASAAARAPYRYVPAWHRATLRVARARGEAPARASLYMDALYRQSARIAGLDPSIKPRAAA